MWRRAEALEACSRTAPGFQALRLPARCTCVGAVPKIPDVRRLGAGMGELACVLRRNAAIPHSNTMTGTGMLEAGGSHGERVPCRAAAPVLGSSTAVSESKNKPQPSFMGVDACADDRRRRRDAGRVWRLNLDTDALMEACPRRTSGRTPMTVVRGGVARTGPWIAAQVAARMAPEPAGPSAGAEHGARVAFLPVAPEHDS